MHVKAIPAVSILLTAMLAASHAHGHGAITAGEANPDRFIVFPDTAGYQTLVLDPHTHSVFSDGHVWPKIRVGEALRDGLDALAITEHLEWQPHLADIPHADRNRAFDDAATAAADSDLIVIRGSEITRNFPAGHINAIFISDANDLIKVTRDAPVDAREFYVSASEWPAQEAVDAANDQGAFVFWNHAWWGRDFPNGIPVIPDFHTDNARNNLLHGIEIANGDSFSEETFQIALDHDLTLIGVSDVHDLIDWDYQPELGGHRPVTLVFAEERNSESIREALFARRTVVWFKNLLIGREPQLGPLLKASITVDSASYFEGSEILVVTLTNHSDAKFQLQSTGQYTFATTADIIELPPHEATRIGVKTVKKVDSLELRFDVLNALVAPKRHPSLVLQVEVGS